MPVPEKVKMKKILCFGDSNTWGCSPVDSTRYDEKTRWPMVMGSLLGDQYQIIEEGLNGRTVLNLSPVDKMANGIESIVSITEKNIPFDIAIINLGLNDVFISEEVTLREISDGVSEIIDIIRKIHNFAEFTEPEIVIMSPSGYNSGIEHFSFIELQFNKLQRLPETYRNLSLKKNCRFFNASDYVTGSIIDGSHIDADSHILLGNKIAEFLLQRVR